MSRACNHGGNVFEVARQLGITPAEIIDFSASINPLGMSASVRKAIVKAIDSLVHYPDSSHTELKQALAEHHGLSPNQFVIANGSTELIYHLPSMLRGTRALIVVPSFGEYTRALEEHHWEVNYFILKPEDNFPIDLAALEHALSHGYDALFLCNPANPSGTLYSLQLVQEVYRLCSASGTFLVLDEAFMDFCEERSVSAKQFMVQSGNGVVLRSMTKFFGIPGLRLGYAIINSTLTERLDFMGGPWNVNMLALSAGVAALQDAEHIRQTTNYICQERKNLIEGLSQFKQLKLFSSCTNYLLVEIIGGMTSLELQSKLMQRRFLEQRILIRDCASFVGLSNNFFRIAVRTAEENARLLNGLKHVLHNQIVQSLSDDFEALSA